MPSGEQARCVHVRWTGGRNASGRAAGRVLVGWREAFQERRVQPGARRPSTRACVRSDAVIQQCSHAAVIRAVILRPCSRNSYGTKKSFGPPLPAPPHACCHHISTFRAAVSGPLSQSLWHLVAWIIPRINAATQDQGSSQRTDSVIQ